MTGASAFPAELAVLRRRFDADAIAPTLGLEEVCVQDASSMAAGLAFLAARGASLQRLTAFVGPHFWFAERGRPYAQGLRRLGIPPDHLLIVTPRSEAETLWALEEVLRSGAASLVVGAVEGASLVATRRLDLMARQAEASVALVRTTPQRHLSAARRRWRVRSTVSAADPYDAKASGAPRWRATLERSRDGASGETTLEFDDETLRLGLAEGLADHRLALGQANPPRTRVAA